MTMIRTPIKDKLRFGIAGLIAVAAICSVAQQRVFAQEPLARFVVPNAEPPLTAPDLETLVGPIALYPDDLISIVLPASTYPLQIVQASRFLDRLENDASLEPDVEWDNAVVALLNYPEVLRLMDENIDWTWALGEAVLDQQAAVMDAVQGFRQRAYLAGNLASDERQFVVENEGAIEINPADPEVIYIPYYEPERVVVVQPRPVFHYYTYPYPLYYYPYPATYRFRTGFFWGVTSAFDIGWHNHYLHVYHHSSAGHPFYNRTYYAPYYARRGINININLNQVSHVWQPTERRVARPHRRSAQGRVVSNGEGYVDNTSRTREPRRQPRPNGALSNRAGATSPTGARRTAPAAARVSEPNADNARRSVQDRSRQSTEAAANTAANAAIATRRSSRLTTSGETRVRRSAPNVSTNQGIGSSLQVDRRSTAANAAAQPRRNANNVQDRTVVTRRGPAIQGAANARPAARPQPRAASPSPTASSGRQAAPRSQAAPQSQTEQIRRSASPRQATAAPPAQRPRTFSSAPTRQSAPARSPVRRPQQQSNNPSRQRQGRR